MKMISLLLAITLFPFVRDKTWADVVFLNGEVLTMNDDSDVAEAIAIEGNRVLRVGSDRQIRRLVGPCTRVIDLKGRALLPGFEDSHIHFLSLAALENQIDLSGVKSIEEMTALLRERDRDIPEESWILGRGWDQERMEWSREYEWPTKEDLDFTAKPVLLLRVCGHIAVANSKALEIAGIDRMTEVDGGVIDRYPDGEPTGVLRERAIDLVTSKIPIEALKPSASDLDAMIRRAVANGITCIEEAGAGLEDMGIYKSALERGTLDLRVNLLLDHSLIDFCAENDISSPYDIKRGRLRICGIKFYADGSLGGRTAALREPYSDDPSNTGVLYMDKDRLADLFERAHDAGLQCCTHAIGDRAIETVLEANKVSYADASAERMRDRIEHCQIMSEDLIQKMKDQGMIASIQFSFAASDSLWAKERVGDRIRTSYAWRSLMDAGIRCSGGTDAPVETFVPLEGIEKIVTRPDNQEQALTLEQAIRLYTSDSAYAQWQDSYLGSLEEGKLADLIVLSENILAVDPSRISELKVDLTMIDGRIVYERG